MLCWRDLKRSKQLSTAANTQAQGVMPATYVAIMPICGYKLHRARMCGIVTCCLICLTPPVVEKV